MDDLKAQHPHYFKLAQKFHVMNELRQRINALTVEITLAHETASPSYQALKAQKSTLALKRNDLAHDPRLNELMDKASANAQTLPHEHLENLKLMQASLFENQAIPYDRTADELTETLKEQHAENKDSGNFDAIRDLFKAKVIHLQDRMDAYKQSYNAQPESLREDMVTSRYDALLRIKESDARAGDIASFTRDIQQKVTPALNHIRESQADSMPVTIQRALSPDKKMALVKEILCLISPDDYKKCSIHASNGSSVSNTTDYSIIRIKTKPKSPVTFLTSALHEFGHALYFLNTKPPKGLEDFPKQPVNYKRGSTTSEGAAYALQMLITLPEFWDFAGPIVRKHYGIQSDDDDANAFTDENLFKLATRLKPEPCGNRLKADQMSRLSHLAMRDRLERDLIEGEIDPGLFDRHWQDRLKEYVGIQSSTAEDGCMQDVHFFKYPKFYGFAFYATGLVFGENALQLSIKKNPNIPTEISNGNFEPIISQYKKDYFRHGARYSAEILLQKAGGKKALDIDLFIKGITGRYIWIDSCKILKSCG